MRKEQHLHEPLTPLEIQMRRINASFNSPAVTAYQRIIDRLNNDPAAIAARQLSVLYDSSAFAAQQRIAEHLDYSPAAVSARQLSALYGNSAFTAQQKVVGCVNNDPVVTSAYQLSALLDSSALNQIQQRVNQIAAASGLESLLRIQQKVLYTMRAVTNSPLTPKVQQPIQDNTSKQPLAPGKPSQEAPARKDDEIIPKTEPTAAIEPNQAVKKSPLSSDTVQFWISIIVQILLFLASPYLPNPTEQQRLEIEKQRLATEEKRLSVEENLADSLDRIRELFEEFGKIPQNDEKAFEEIVIAGHGLVEALEIAEHPAVKLGELAVPPEQSCQEEKVQPNSSL